jgi:hypothetical protein
MFKVNAKAKVISIVEIENRLNHSCKSIWFWIYFCFFLTNLLKTMTMTNERTTSDNERLENNHDWQKSIYRTKTFPSNIQHCFH